MSERAEMLNSTPAVALLACTVHNSNIPVETSVGFYREFFLTVLDVGVVYNKDVVQNILQLCSW